MNNNQDLFMNSSIIYRCSQKYFDKQLLPYEIGAGQLQFLISIYENEGVSMNVLASTGMYDKGTITKGVQKLEELGFVRSEASDVDRRSRCLYTTDKTKQLIGQIYLIRREWWDRIVKNLEEDDVARFEYLLQVVANNASMYMEENEKGIRFFGFQKLSLVDYPEKIAATVFTGGCQLRCPFCHNSGLVFLPENIEEVKATDVSDYLKKRKGIIEGVCITGGEPLLHDELEDFIVLVKELGYQVKIDTNGCFPDKLKDLIEKKLVDYVAVDIKNSAKKYATTVGLKDFDINPVLETIEYLLTNVVDYEFRTTIVEEFHSEKDVVELLEMIKGAKKYVIQNFVDSDQVIQKGLHSVSNETLIKYRDIAGGYVDNVIVRGT